MVTLDKLSWNGVNWQQVESQISQIQRQIYKAKVQGNLGLTHYLQNKLATSLDAKLLSTRNANKVLRNSFTNGVGLLGPRESITLMKSLDLKKRVGRFYPRFYADKVNAEVDHNLLTCIEIAKQNLIKLAIEPEWQALFDIDSRQSRPGTTRGNVLRKVVHLIDSKPKYVLSLNMAPSFQHFNSKQFVRKLGTIKIVEENLQKWLESNCISDHVTRKRKIYEVRDFPVDLASLLYKIVFYKLLCGLSFWDARWRRKPPKNPVLNLKCVQYLNVVLIVSSDVTRLERIKKILPVWLMHMDLNCTERQFALKKATQGFTFGGNHIIVVRKKKKYHTKIHISGESKNMLLAKTRIIIRKNKASSAYFLIQQLIPLMFSWKSHFRHLGYSQDFKKIDNRIFGQLRAWAFRRKAAGKTRTFLKEKYFPSKKHFLYANVLHKDNWVLCGETKNKNGQIKKNYLPKLAWSE